MKRKNKELTFGQKYRKAIERDGLVGLKFGDDYSSNISEVAKFRTKHAIHGFELVDITQLCEFKLGYSGWCNNFNEADEKCYHIQIWYRNENIGTVVGNDMFMIDENKHCVFVEDDGDFIIFRRVPLK